MSSLLDKVGRFMRSCKRHNSCYDYVGVTWKDVYTRLIGFVRGHVTVGKKISQRADMNTSTWGQYRGRPEQSDTTTCSLQSCRVLTVQSFQQLPLVLSEELTQRS